MYICIIFLHDNIFTVKHGSNNTYYYLIQTTIVPSKWFDFLHSLCSPNMQKTVADSGKKRRKQTAKSRHQIAI